MTNEADDETATVERIVRGLDTVLFEICRIDNLWQDAPRDVTNTAMIHEARRRTNQLYEMADAYLRWVADTRLEPPTN